MNLIVDLKVSVVRNYLRLFCFEVWFLFLMLIVVCKYLVYGFKDYLVCWGFLSLILISEVEYSWILDGRSNFLRLYVNKLFRC